MGISVGWGDTYQAGLAYQWIDVTGVPAGTYHVRTSADPLGHYLETSEGNNCSWAQIRIGATGSRVTVLDRGHGCEPPGGPEPTPTPIPTGLAKLGSMNAAVTQIPIAPKKFSTAQPYLPRYASPASVKRMLNRNATPGFFAVVATMIPFSLSKANSSRQNAHTF